jgi:SAM-dependent methyltransferase
MVISHPEIYSQDYYQRIFDLEDRYWWHRGMREITAALIRSQPGGGQPFRRVLDAGCGTGATMAWADHTFGPEAVFGVDIAREALQFCRGRTGPLLAQASIMELPFARESFDLVLCQDVIQHLPTDGGDVAALSEMYRVLRSGGYLLIRANSRLGMWQEKEARDADFQRFTLPEVVSRLRAAGFDVRRSTYANALPALYGSLKQWRRRRERVHAHDQHHQPHQHRRLYDGLRTEDRTMRRAWFNQARRMVEPGPTVGAPCRGLLSLQGEPKPGVRAHHLLPWAKTPWPRAHAGRTPPVTDHDWPCARN